MPKINLEILRTVEITREESVVVEVNVPKSVIDGDEVYEWVETQLESDTSPLTRAVRDEGWEATDVPDETIAIGEVNNLSE